MKMSFWAGALAGFLVGSTKQGCAVRENMGNLVNGFFSGNKNEGEKAQDDVETEDPLPASVQASESEPAETPETFEPGGLDFDKATKMAEKLSAKVSEPQGEESLPHSHHIDIPINRLSA